MSVIILSSNIYIYIYISVCVLPNQITLNGKEYHGCMRLRGVEIFNFLSN